MKKTLLILIILFTNIFSQDILITMKGTEYKGEFISKTDNSISFKAVGMLNAQKIHIKTIERLILADGTAVIKNGYFIEDGESLVVMSDKRKELLRQYRSETINSEDGESLKDKKKISLSTIGGSLIGLSGVLMYSTNQKTLNSDATLKEVENFYDEIKSNFDLSYLLLTVGGILIAIDNS